MKTLFLATAFGLLFGLSAKADETIYMCTSSKGEIFVVDNRTAKDALLDFSLHEFIGLTGSYTMLSNLVKDPATSQTDFVIQISNSTYSRNEGTKFENSGSKIYIKSKADGVSQSCSMNMTLYKSSQSLVLNYSCSTLFNRGLSFTDVLKCQIQ